MRGLSRDDALAFYRKYYAPHNAIVVISGDITMEQAKPLAEKYYGAIPKSGDPAPRKRSTYLPHRADTRVTMTHERVLQPEWSREYVAPSYNVGSRADVYALETFAELLGNGSTSKLYRALVVDRKLAAAAGASYDPNAISYGTFYASLTPSPGVSIDKLEAAYDTLLASILKDGISDADVERAKTRMIARLAYAKDSPISAAYQVGAAMVVGVSLADIENIPSAIKAVTPDQVRSAARNLVATASTGTAVLLPQPKPQAQAQKAGNAP
jgi:zinc protease